MSQRAKTIYSAAQKSADALLEVLRIVPGETRLRIPTHLVTFGDDEGSDEFAYYENVANAVWSIVRSSRDHEAGAVRADELADLIDYISRILSLKFHDTPGDPEATRGLPPAGNDPA